MTILMVTGGYYPEISTSGIQCRALARLLADRATIEVLTTAIDPALVSNDDVDGVRVRRVYVDVHSALSRVVALIAMAVQLVRSLPRIDVVHIHGYSTKNILVTIMARLFRRPIVLSLHTAGHDEPSAVRRAGALAWWAYAAADRYLSVSPSLVDAYLTSGLPAERVRLVGNAIDIGRFAPGATGERAELRQQLGLPAGRPIVLFVGVFSRDKQPDVLFDAWCRLQGGAAPALVFVGATRSKFEVDDRLEAGMRDRARELGLLDRLVFAGTTHRVDDYLKAADVFALPSGREGLPVALLEAMATGLPCVASRLPGSTDTIIDDGVNGVLVPPGDAGALAAALAAVLADAERSARMGTAARATVEARFAAGLIAEEWLAAYAAVRPTAH